MGNNLALSIEEIDAAEHGIKRIRVLLGEMGRELYAMRNGSNLGPEYAFDSYSRQNYGGSHYYQQEGPDWGVGTPIMSVNYYWPRAEDSITITFPMRYLLLDWREEESSRLDAERASEEAASNRQAVEDGEKRELFERSEFLRLKEKFESAAHPPIAQSQALEPPPSQQGAD